MPMTEADANTMQMQCWICPKCHDDHRQDGPCTPPSDEPFMPAPEDGSYIAQEYRKLRAQVEQLRAERDAALRECEEQARLNGMGAQREAKLVTELAQRTLEAGFYREALKLIADGGVPHGQFATAIERNIEMARIADEAIGGSRG